MINESNEELLIKYHNLIADICIEYENMVKIKNINNKNDNIIKCVDLLGQNIMFLKRILAKCGVLEMLQKTNIYQRLKKIYRR